jgi:hypothetical protein
MKGKIKPAGASLAGKNNPLLSKGFLFPDIQQAHFEKILQMLLKNDGYGA